MPTTKPIDSGISPLPDKTGGQLKADVRKADGRHARRVALAAVLYDALVILRITRHKQQAAFLGRDPRTLRRWFDGTEPIPWEELLMIPDLRWPLCQALLEGCRADLVEIVTTIRLKRPA